MPYAVVADLLEHPKVTETRGHMHHGIPKYEHLLRSVHLSYRLAPVFGADRSVCARAAILHDIDSRLGTLTTHAAIAANHAARIGETEEVCQAIISHMYPLGPAPTTREGWVLVVADKLASLGDMTSFLGGLFTGRSLHVQRQLRQSDPFVAQNRAQGSWWVRQGKGGKRRWLALAQPHNRRNTTSRMGNPPARMRFFRSLRG